MTRRWAVRIERAEINSLKRLRLAAGAEVCERGGEIWVRGGALDESLAMLLRKHPHARRHWVLDDDQLVRPGARVPDGRLPAGPWEPLCAWLAVRFPPAAFAVGAVPRAPVRLVRSDDEETPTHLMVPLRVWSRYAAIAPRVRLARWSFAVSADGRTLVRGEPVPPLPGQRFVARCNVAAPAGWRWDPPVDALVLRAAFDVREHDLVLLHADGSWERIGGEQFVQASRAAVRATEREFRDD